MQELANLGGWLIIAFIIFYPFILAGNSQEDPQKQKKPHKPEIEVLPKDRELDDAIAGLRKFGFNKSEAVLMASRARYLDNRANAPELMRIALQCRG